MRRIPRTQIELHYGQVTDQQKVLELSTAYPLSTAMATHVVAAAAKVLEKGSGGFLGPFRLASLYGKLFALSDRLIKERYLDAHALVAQNDRHRRGALTAGFLNEFSYAFPNWREEYTLIDQRIEDAF
jgi:hypothetical protein